MSWPMVSIGDFCITGSGGTPSRKNPEFYDGDIPWVKSGDLREGLITSVSEHISELAIQKSSAKLIPKGALLLAMYGATVGRMAELGIDAATNQAVCNITPDPDKANSRYVYYALLDKVPEFLRNAVGGAQPNISQGMIKNTKIALPPILEQKRIAMILDKANAIRRKRQQAIELADEFLRSVFLDMFGDPVVNPKGWNVKKIGNVCTFQGGYAFKSADYVKAGIPLVKITNVHLENLDWSEVDYISTDNLEARKDFLLKRDDLVMAMTRPIIKSLGTVKLVEIKEPDIPCFLNQRVGRFKDFENTVNKDYFKYFLLSDHFKAKVEKLCSVALQPNISSKQIEDIAISIPDIALQEKFSKIVAKTTSIRKNLIKSSKQSGIIFNSLSQKAFSGNL